MMELDANDLKDQGNALFRNGDYTGAMRLYSQALTVERGNAVCFHNRAACKLHLKDYEGAVADASEAISWKRDYAKAYATKSAGLRYLGRLTEARETVNAGLTESPDNQTLKETLAQIERTIAGGSTPAPSAGAAPPSASSSTPRAASGGSGRTVMWNGLPVPERKLDRGVRGARLAVLLLLIVFLLPTGVLSGRAYMLMLVLAAGAHGAAMVARHGLPAGRDIATAAAYLSALGEHESLHLLFLPLLFATQSPNIVAALVSVDFHVLDAAQWLHTAAAAKAPAVAGALARAGALIAPYIAQRPPAELARLSPSAHRTAVIGGLVHHNAYAELMLLVLSVLRLLTPARSIVATLALWQVLQLRFSTSAATRDACGALDAAVSKLAFHPACPAPIGNGYTWLRGFLRSRVRSPEDMQTEAQARRAAGPGGGAPSCSIM